MGAGNAGRRRRYIKICPFHSHSQPHAPNNAVHPLNRCQSIENYPQRTVPERWSRQGATRHKTSTSHVKSDWKIRTSGIFGIGGAVLWQCAVNPKRINIHFRYGKWQRRLLSHNSQTHTQTSQSKSCARKTVEIKLKTQYDRLRRQKCVTRFQVYKP